MPRLRRTTTVISPNPSPAERRPARPARGGGRRLTATADEIPRNGKARRAQRPQVWWAQPASHHRRASRARLHQGQRRALPPFQRHRQRVQALTAQPVSRPAPAARPPFRGWHRHRESAASNRAAQPLASRQMIERQGQPPRRWPASGQARDVWDLISRTAWIFRIATPAPGHGRGPSVWRLAPVIYDG